MENFYVLCSERRNMDNSILDLSGYRISGLLLFANYFFDGTKTASVLNITIEYIVSTKSFNVPLISSRLL